ncbi:DUF4097 family beta strand repeat-containing protein [Actinomadura rupiterrae]|uniref:DUF4097 family beta strand repeat-containing protein n=1 Tax=Actinomadura rupiterrae TaxID=559627 RepID=UPI0020A5EB37|nr:DUF4097 family beta strand repeat-containing protein [Actinomadura rupiterrae]MCP2343381.1 hypothetical protein [Actinomadura rupiterrae]
MTSRTLTASVAGPAVLAVDLPHGRIETITESGRRFAEVTVTATGDDPELAAAVRDARIEFLPDPTRLLVKVPAVSAGRTVTVSDGAVRITQSAGRVATGFQVGGVSFHGGVFDLDEITVNGVPVSELTAGPSGMLMVTARLPAGSGVVASTESADLDVTGCYEGIKFDSTSGSLTGTKPDDHTRYLIAKTGSGAVRVTSAVRGNVSSTSGAVWLGWTSEIQAVTKSGAIQVDRLSGPRADLSTASGAITAHAAEPGEVTAESRSGAVTVTASPHLTSDLLTVSAFSRSGRVRTPHTAAHRTGGAW